MTIDTKYSFDLGTVQQYSEQQGEPQWLLDLRKEAFAKIDELPLPKPDKTNIKNWNFFDFKQHSVKSDPVKALNDLPETVKGLVDVHEKNQALYIQRDNTAVFSSLPEQLKEKGVIFTDIFTAAKNHPELLEKYYMKDAVKMDEHRLTALHAALLNGGTFVYVPKNVEVDVPLQAVFMHENPDTTLFNHVIVVAESNSSLTYIENYIDVGGKKESIVNIISEVYAHANAKVTYGAVDTLAENVTTYVNRRGIVDRDAKIEWALGLMNNGDTISDNTTYLMGDNSYGDTKTVVVGRGKQKQNFTTKVVHYGKNSQGYILKRGVMKEGASSIFNGIGKIEKGASKSNAEQESRILMLSDQARGDANPMLLIDEDDVTAGHAASVGRVDPVQLYYLMSRGISKVEAERLIIHGFLAPVVNILPIEGVKRQLSEVIERKVQS